MFPFLILGAIVAAVAAAASEGNTADRRPTDGDAPAGAPPPTSPEPDRAAQPAHEAVDLTDEEQQAWRDVTGDHRTGPPRHATPHTERRGQVRTFMARLAGIVISAGRRVLSWIATNRDDLLRAMDDWSAHRSPGTWWDTLRLLVTFAPTLAR